MKDDEFLTDVQPLLRPEVVYDPKAAWEMVQEKLVELPISDADSVYEKRQY